MKLNGTRLEKRSPRKKKNFQSRNGGQKTLLKSNGVSVRKLQLEKSKPAKFSWQKHRNTRRFRGITRPFIPLLIFPFTLQRLVREKFHFKKKNPTFCCAGVKWFHFKFSRGLERSVRGVRMGKSGPLKRASLANQIQGSRIPDRWDAFRKKLVLLLKKWLDRMVLMTWYLVTIATDFHLTLPKWVQRICDQLWNDRCWYKILLKNSKKNVVDVGATHPPVARPRVKTKQSKSILKWKFNDQ